MIFTEIYEIKSKMPANTYRTIIGQIKAGDITGAKVGIDRIKVKLAKEEKQHENSSRK